MIETHLHRSRQTLKLGLIKLIPEIFPGEAFKTAYSIQEGVFCRLNDSVLSVREVKLVEKRLDEWLKSKPLVEFIGREKGYYHYRADHADVRMVYLCETDWTDVVPYSIIPYSTGFIVDFGDVGAGGTKPLIPPDKLSATYEKTQNWLRNVDIEVIGDVNEYIRAGETLKLLTLSEALHEKEMADIADMILQEHRALRILLISGPSSAGKTSFAQRISTQLRVNGMKPVPLSMDDYFLNREDSPKDKDGKYDFESLDALDLPYFQDQVRQLVEGKSVETPIFDFVSGRRLTKTRTTQVGPHDILVIEGIHALNPKLLPDVNRNAMFKIYLNALYQINIDLVNRIPSSEIRLIRRLVRGDRFRGTPPEDTLDRWASVRLGEFNNVFKFQEEADVMFDSSLLYELNAMRPYVEASLKKIPEGSQYEPVKERLLNLLTFCEPMDVSKVPFNSILREFIGDSLYF